MSAPEPVLAADVSQAVAASARRRVLLIEGEEDQANYWSVLLASLGFEVSRVVNLDAARALLVNTPSIIACSSTLADGTAIEFFAEVRTRPELALLYLVLLTTSVGQDEVIASLRGGANDCIDMSSSYGEIRARLELAERVISLNEALHQKSAALGDALAAIQNELHAAANLQAAMLPKALDCRGFRFQTLYRPSDMLGGDMLGLAAVGEDQVALGLIDVVGHGTASALISCSLIREIMDRMSVLLREPTSADTAPRTVIEEMNQRYCRLNIPGMYFTALTAVLDTRSGMLRYCQAGHPSLLCLEPRTGWREIEDSGYPVGLVESADYSLREVQLAPGQLLLAVSDGLLRPCESDPGGTLGLFEALSSTTREPEQVLARLEHHTAEVRGFERDDQSALLIHWSADNRAAWEV